MSASEGWLGFPDGQNARPVFAETDLEKAAFDDRAYDATDGNVRYFWVRIEHAIRGDDLAGALKMISSGGPRGRYTEGYYAHPGSRAVDMANLARGILAGEQLPT